MRGRRSKEDRRGCRERLDWRSKFDASEFTLRGSAGHFRDSFAMKELPVGNRPDRTGVDPGYYVGEGTIRARLGDGNPGIPHFSF